MSKANFTQVDTSYTEVGSPFYVQFNPKDLKLTDSSKWKVGEEVSKEKPSLTYEKGDPAKLMMELIFDTTDDGSSVEENYVKNLRAFFSAALEAEDDEGNATTQPYFSKFTWNEFEFVGVIEKLVVTYMMFSSTGVPLRAKVKLTMMEGEEPEITFASSGAIDVAVPNSLITAGAVDSVVRDISTATFTATCVAGANDTASSIAAQTGATAQDIATANNLDDPMNIEPGTELVIPSGPAEAAKLAAEGLSEVASNWSEDASELSPFGDEGVSEALEGLMEEAGLTPEALDEVMEEIGATTSAVIEEVEEAVEEAIEEVEEAIEEAIEEVEEAVEEVIEEVEEAVEEVEEAVEEVIEEVEEAVEEAVEEVEEAVEEAVEEVEEAVEQISSVLPSGGDDE
jgi:LysM repeat protein/uncharacterized protein YoxC